MSNVPKPVLTFQPHNSAIVAVVGCRNLTHETIQQLKCELEVALSAGPSSSLVLDLSQVEFLPSLAMGMLVNIHKAIEQAGGKCMLVGMKALVLESIRITRLDQFFQIHGSIDEGLQHA